MTASLLGGFSGDEERSESVLTGAGRLGCAVVPSKTGALWVGCACWRFAGRSSSTGAALRLAGLLAGLLPRDTFRLLSEMTGEYLFPCLD